MSKAVLWIRILVCVGDMLSLSKLPCFADIVNRKPMHGRSITILDGARGIAALAVLVEHTQMVTNPIGLDGVWLFFVLSGYLLTPPFIHCPAYTAKWVGSYFLRRFLRILPMYVVYVCMATYFLHCTQDWLIDHLTFRLTTAHLWTVKQDVVFYLILPFIMLLTLCLGKYPFRIAGILVVVAYLLSSYLPVRLSSPTAGKTTFFFIAPFMEGMAIAYVMEGIKDTIPRYQLRHLSPLGALVFGGVFIFLLWGTPPEKPTYHSWGMGLLFSAFIVWAQIIPKSVAYSVLNSLPLRAIGIVGYSFYLLHWLVKEWFLSYKPYPVLYFSLTLISTYLLACVTYTLIEKPAMGIGKRWYGHDRIRGAKNSIRISP